jgi:hypothetical protein
MSIQGQAPHPLALHFIPLKYLIFDNPPSRSSRPKNFQVGMEKNIRVDIDASTELIDIALHK